MENLFIFATCHGNVISRLLNLSQNFKKKFDTEVRLNFTSPGVPADPKEYLDKILKSKFFIYQNNRYINNELIYIIRKNTQVIKIPYITSSIYWPSMVSPKIGERLLCSDKFPFGLIPFRCSILDTLIKSALPEKEIVKQYCSLDIAEHVDVSLNHSNQINFLRTQEMGDLNLNLADYISNSFSHKHLFYLFNHPSVEIFRFIANRILDILSISNDLPRELPDNFMYHQLPIHPSIIKYYGLTFSCQDTLWPLGPNKVSFEKYVSLYIRGYYEISGGGCQ